MSQTAARCRLVALISGRGSNLQAILDGAADGTLPIDPIAVISNRPGALGLERAHNAGVPAATLDHREFTTREMFEKSLAELIQRQEPDLVILAGFMRKLGPHFVDRYRGCMMNIHPSLLPKFRGLNTHARAIASGARVHGASVHFVTPDLDAGPVILQAEVPVLPDDDAQTLAERVLVQEHRIFPLAIKWFAEGRIGLQGDRVLFDNQPLAAPIVL